MVFQYEGRLSVFPCRSPLRRLLRHAYGFQERTLGILLGKLSCQILWSDHRFRILCARVHERGRRHIRLSHRFRRTRRRLFGTLRQRVETSGNPGGKLLYIGDAEDKDLYVDTAGLEALKLPITEHSKLPDIVISDEKRGWQFLIEVVTSHGPVSAKRVVELEEFTKDCPYGIVYVTAFPNAKEFKKHVDDIAWETEVWLSDAPDHMIHFNGDRFIGPRK